LGDTFVLLLVVGGGGWAWLWEFGWSCESFRGKKW
jgi:hypothetical protein